MIKTFIGDFLFLDCLNESSSVVTELVSLACVFYKLWFLGSYETAMVLKSDFQGAISYYLAPNFQF